MISKIHILGAAGSGTTTLAEAKLDCPILKLEEDITVEERVNAVIDIMHKR